MHIEERRNGLKPGATETRQGPCTLLPAAMGHPCSVRPRWAEAATFPPGGGPGKEGARALVLGASSWFTLGAGAVLGVLLFPDLTLKAS